MASSRMPKAYRFHDNESLAPSQRLIGREAHKYSMTKAPKVQDTPGPLGRNGWGDPNLHPVMSKAALTAASKPFAITDIPAVMDKLKWVNGAKFLRRWFAGKANINVDSVPPDTTTIKMKEFILTFDRGKKAYKAAVKLITSPKTLANLVSNLEEKRLFTTFKTEFGDFTLPMKEQHKNHCNFVPVGGLTPTFDDLTASLGNFSLYIIPKGTVTPLGSFQFKVSIASVGVYAKDIFEFNNKPGEDQFLGYWDENGPSA